MRRIRSHLTYANVMATLAMFAALGGGAYAAATIGADDIKRNAVRSKHIKRDAVKSTEVQNGAIQSGDVKDFGLRLHDLGSKFRNKGTTTVQTTFTVPPNTCSMRLVDGGNPTPPGLIGSLVVGFLTDDQGDAVLNNLGVVLPTIVSETSQNGAFANLVVCDYGGGGQTIPAGSLFHYHIIGP